MAPCSHVWHYKCIRPILNDHKTWPHFLCPNCRAVTDLEADVDDLEEETWEDDVDGTGSSPDMSSIHRADGSIHENDEVALDGDVEALSVKASRLLSIRDDAQSTPSPTTSSEHTNGLSSSANLLTRRGARRISPPFSPTKDPSDPSSTAGQVQFLRPITPTQPLMGNDDIPEPSLRTPTTTDLLTHDGPMTPTNNAGPFVFDGSAGRSAGRRTAAALSESTINKSTEA